ASTEKVEELPDKVKEDGSTVKRHTWTCKGPAVSLLEVKGGGHSWPRPDARGTDVNRDIDTADEIMKFFGLAGGRTHDDYGGGAGGGRTTPGGLARPAGRAVSRGGSMRERWGESCGPHSGPQRDPASTTAPPEPSTGRTDLRGAVKPGGDPSFPRRR